MNWFKRLLGTSNNNNVTDPLDVFDKRIGDIKASGSVGDGHYTDSVEKVKQLKREGKNREAIEVLLRCVDATEAESMKANSMPALDEKFAWLSEGRTENGLGVAPWYYEQIAIIYRKEKQYAKEVEILERYERQKKSPGVGPQKLADRLVVARALMNKNLS